MCLLRQLPFGCHTDLGRPSEAIDCTTAKFGALWTSSAFFGHTAMFAFLLPYKTPQIETVKLMLAHAGYLKLFLPRFVSPIPGYHLPNFKKIFSLQISG